MRSSDWRSDVCSSDLKRALAPARIAARTVGNDPDLEQRRLLVLQVELAVGDAGAGAHHLDVACRGAARIAHGVAVADRAGADIGDDLHVDRKSTRLNSSH